MQLISDCGSERATNDSGKILNSGGKTHVMWQDVTREGYFNRVRSLDQATGIWSDPVTLDQGIDNHARGVMTIDAEGYLHCVLGGHGSAVTWCQSLRPNDSSQWTEPEDVGVGTYPVFICAPDGTLYLTLRGMGAERHQRGLDICRKPPGGAWEPARRIVKLAEEHGQAYAGFHMQMDVAPDGALHIIVDFYEGEDDFGRGLHQAACYACSRDGGATWQKADGSNVRLPARPEDMDTLARNTMRRHEKTPPPEIKHGGLVVTSAGAPHFFWLHHTEAPGHLIHGTVDDAGQLRQQAVSDHWEQLWPDMRAVGCRSMVRADDAIIALITLTPFNDEWEKGRPTRAMNMIERSDQRLVWLVSQDGGQTFSAQPFLSPGASYNTPSLEKSVGANVIDADRMPGVLFFDGSSAYPGGGEYYDGSRSVETILADGEFQATNVWLA